VPKRNLILAAAILVSCVVAIVARDQTSAGRRFAEVLALVDRAYLKPVDDDDLVDAAIDAAVGRLDDHSEFVRGEGKVELEAALDQQFGGVGLELAIEAAGREPAVVSAVVGSPAWRAGIRPGDRLVAIDGRATAGLGLRQVVGLLRGEIGATVTVRVAAPAADTLDPAATTTRDVALVRELVELESVLGDRRRDDGTWDFMIEGEPGIALVRITSFGERTAAEFEAAVALVADVPDLRALVLDLRGNPGGLLGAAVEVCDLLLDEGVVVVTRGRGDVAATQGVRRANAGSRLAGVPILVLVDGLTASAAEIVAAALQDHGRGRIVGSRTFGKGTVQSILPLSDGRGLLKLTTAEFLRPAHASLPRLPEAGAEWGVSPDEGLHVSLSAEAARAVQQWRRHRDAPARGAAGTGTPREADPVLARALTELDSSPPTSR
jgi:carboxyl-terminal processing protease